MSQQGNIPVMVVTPEVQLELMTRDDQSKIRRRNNYKRTSNEYKYRKFEGKMADLGAVLGAQQGAKNDPKTTPKRIKVVHDV